MLLAVIVMGERMKLNLPTLLTGLFLYLLVVGCERNDKGDAPVPKMPGSDAVLSDKPLAPYQIRLLEVGFDTATALPLVPHKKRRARTQEAVAMACLELDQPLRAMGYTEQIQGWRQGACFADIASHCARKNETLQAERCLDLAKSISERSADWQRERIRVKMAKAYAWLRRDAQAERLQEGLAEAETGKVAQVQASLCDEDAFDKQVKALDELVKTGHFDIMRNVAEAYARLFDSIFADEARRDVAEERVKSTSAKMPLFIRIRLLGKLAAAAAGHGDKAKAIELIDEADALLGSAYWRPENRIPHLAALAELRFSAGGTEKAKKDADAALALYEKNRDQIGITVRAKTLRSLAETYRAMQDAATALEVYRRAVDEGATNRNSRPRAEDLATTCVSMALHEAEPDAQLWQRIRQIREGLGDPW